MHKGCNGITTFYDENNVIVGTPEMFYHVRLPECEIFGVQDILDWGKYCSIKYYNGRLYCLCRKDGDTKRKLVVLDSTNYNEIQTWKVCDRDRVGGFAVMSGKVYVGNRQSIDIYTTKGLLVERVVPPDVKMTTDIIALGNDRLIICDFAAGKVLVIKADGSEEWSVNIDSPIAATTDWLNNLWVWSKDEKKVYVISDEGK